MASNLLGKLTIAITATTTGLEKAMKKTTATLGGLGRAASSVPGLGAMVGVGAAGVGLVKVADDYELIGARLQYLTGSAGEAEKAQEKLFAISQETGTSFKDNAAALTRFQMASGKTGLSTEENIDLLNALNKSMLMTGTSGTEAASAMVQLGQALASGELMGEELRAVKEAAPAAAEAIAAYFGKASGDLKQLGAEGKLTSEAVAAALLKMGYDFDASFQELPDTAGQSMQRVLNAFGQVWSNISENTGLLDDLTDKIDDLGQWIVDNQEEIAGWGDKIYDAFKAAGPTFEKLKETIKAMGPAFKKFIKIVEMSAPPVIKMINKALDGWYLIFTKGPQIVKDLQAGITQTGPIADNRAEGGGSVFDAAMGYGALSPAGFGDSSSTSETKSVTNIFNQKISRSDALAISNESLRAAAR